jgi:ankyrin repeat protein
MTDQEKSFIEACFRMDLKSIKQCIQYNVDIHTEDDWCIDIAARKGDSKIIKFFLENGISHSSAAKKLTLAYAVHNEDLDLVRYLVSISEEYKKDSASIQWAAAKGNKVAVELLLPYVNDLRWVYCNAAKFGHIDLIRYLNDNNIYEHDSALNLTLNWAAQSKNWEIIDLLLSEGIVEKSTLSERLIPNYDEWKSRS